MHRTGHIFIHQKPTTAISIRHIEMKARVRTGGNIKDYVEYECDQKKAY
jgi:hypothetical protein